MHQNQRGFTLIEILVVLGVLILFVGLTSVNLGRPIPPASLASVTDTLVSDIKSQQLLAMADDIGSTTAAQPHGLVFASTQYTLFANSPFSAGDTNNLVITFDAGVTLANTFPSNQLVFTKATGEVQGFTNGSNTITLTGSLGTKTITVGRFGAVTVN